MSLEEKRRRNCPFPQILLRTFNNSFFNYLYHSGNDQAMLNCKALDHKTFAKLLKIFKPYIDSYTMDDEGDIRLLH